MCFAALVPNWGAPGFLGAELAQERAQNPVVFLEPMWLLEGEFAAATKVASHPRRRHIQELEGCSQASRRGGGGRLLLAAVVLLAEVALCLVLEPAKLPPPSASTSAVNNRTTCLWTQLAGQQQCGCGRNGNNSYVRRPL